MFQRLRHLLVAVTSTAAVATTVTVALAAPAHAEPGVTCAAPSISGEITRLYNPISGTSSLRISASGATTANCPTATTDYRYKVRFQLSTATQSIVTSTSVAPQYFFGTRIGTRIDFPDANLPAPNVYFNQIYVFIETYSKAKSVNFWLAEPSNVQTYKISGSSGEYSTYDLEQQSGACYPLGFTKGGC